MKVKIGSIKNNIVKIAKLIRNYFPITIGGLILCVSAAIAWKVEVVGHVNQVMFAALMVITAVFALLLFLTLLTSLCVGLITRQTNHRTTLVDEYDAGNEVSSGYRIFCPFFIPCIEITAEQLPGQDGVVLRWERHGTWLVEYVRFTQRGTFHQLQRRISVADIFSLTNMCWETKTELSVTVLPAPANLNALAMVKTTSGEGYSHPAGDPKGELVEMRRYQAGDPIRLVLWKVFARSRKLLVRAPENAIEEKRDMFVYLVSGSGDDASASLAREFLQASDNETTSYLFAADGSEKLVKNSKEGLTDVINSVNYRDRGTETLKKLGPQVPDAMLGNSFFLVPCQDGDWLAKLPNFMSIFGHTPVFLIGIEGDFQQDIKRRKLRRKRSIFFHHNNELIDRLASFNKVCQTLSKLGEVRAIYRESGQMMTADEMEALRKL